MSDPLDLLWDRRLSAHHYLEAAGILERTAPQLQEKLLQGYARISTEVRTFFKTEGGRCGHVKDTWGEAHAYMIASAREFSHLSHLLTALDDEAIESAADSAARHCWARRTRERRLDYAREHHVELPRGPHVTAGGIDRRLTSRDFWRGRLRRSLPREAEEAFRRAGWVHAKASPYLSDAIAARYVQQQHQTAAKLRALALVCPDTGEYLELEDVVAHSLANPAHRNAELMSHARGVQEYAGAHAHTCLMVTATAPSRFHPRLQASGAANPKYDGSTVRDAQRWLRARWALARALFKRGELEHYGWRVAEPHHDGTPHWHLILYCRPDQRAELEAVLQRAWNPPAEAEPGAAAVRLQCTAEDPERGSAVGYLAKYVAKNLAGGTAMDALGSDSSDLTVAEARDQAVIWARVHGIRQFQCFGQPVKYLWRLARRLGALQSPEGSVLATLVSHCVSAEEAATAVSAPEDGILKGTVPVVNPQGTGETDIDRPAVPAPRPSWCAVIEQLGGHLTAYRASREFLERAAPRERDPHGRAVLHLNRWGEFCPDKPIGLHCLHGARWVRLVPREVGYARVRSYKKKHLSGSGSDLGPVALTVTEPRLGQCLIGIGLPARAGPMQHREVIPDADPLSHAPGKLSKPTERLTIGYMCPRWEVKQRFRDPRPIEPLPSSAEIRAWRERDLAAGRGLPRK